MVDREGNGVVLPLRRSDPVEDREVSISLPHSVWEAIQRNAKRVEQPDLGHAVADIVMLVYLLSKQGIIDESGNIVASAEPRQRTRKPRAPAA